jgi:hypothetical protein
MQGHWEDGVEGGGGKMGIEVRDGKSEEWLLEM